MLSAAAVSSEVQKYQNQITHYNDPINYHDKFPMNYDQFITINHHSSSNQLSPNIDTAAYYDSSCSAVDDGMDRPASVSKVIERGNVGDTV